MVMTVKYLTDAEKLESRALWEEAFPEDFQAFTDYYYTEKLRDNRILAIAEASLPGVRRAAQTTAAVRERKTVVTERARTWRLESMIQRNPYRVRMGNQRAAADYLAGVATRKEKRRRGYMSSLMMRVLKDMREEQMPFCFLMPADADIYAPFGFTWVYRQQKRRLKADAAQKLTKRSLLPWYDNNEYQSRAADVAVFMNTWLDRHYQVHTLRDEDYVLRLLDEIASRDGSFDVYYDGGQIAAVESEWGPEESREQRLLYAEDAWAEDAGAAEPAVMARITCPETFVKAIHLKASGETPELRLRLKLEDSVVDENNRTWIWKLDRRSSRLERVYEDAMVRVADRAKPDLVLTPAEFASWLFGYGTPGAAMPFAEQIETLSGVFLDEIV